MSNGDIVRVSRVELEGIALAAARTAVQELQTSFMATLGLNISNSEDVKEFQATIRFAESLKNGSAKIGARVVMTAITVIAGAVAISSWEFVKNLSHKLF